ncbi:hypothetical protein A0J61_10980 [Choanephora cucurbitarum]|uniref:Helitron helicase-like domain-containing protein n=1 Tax=Choanephora cucurbitarum TaxID=101091 RepID=A0A1C7MVU3_9FUNG|nr:hypothetical protein A0J61_10980 [Choanephora cucurbitarum]
MSNVYYAACNEPGHLRRTFRGCRMNPLNQANISDAVNQPSNLNNSTINEPSNTTRIVRSRNQQPTLNIAKDTTALQTVRDDRGSMDCVCSYCGAMINIRLYNSFLSFTSFGVNLDLSLANSSVGSYTFRIWGSPYHLIGSVMPPNNANPKFAQIYIYDAKQELANRYAIALCVNITTLQQLQQLMNRLNPFVSIFKNMTQIANDQRNSSEAQANEIESLENIKLVFRAEGVPDRRRYNRPTHGSEVAAINYY